MQMELDVLDEFKEFIMSDLHDKTDYQGDVYEGWGNLVHSPISLSASIDDIFENGKGTLVYSMCVAIFHASKSALTLSKSELNALERKYASRAPVQFKSYYEACNQNSDIRQCYAAFIRLKYICERIKGDAEYFFNNICDSIMYALYKSLLFIHDFNVVHLFELDFFHYTDTLADEFGLVFVPHLFSIVTFFSRLQIPEYIFTGESYGGKIAAYISILESMKLKFSGAFDRSMYDFIVNKCLEKIILYDGSYMFNLSPIHDPFLNEEECREYEYILGKKIYNTLTDRIPELQMHMAQILYETRTPIRYILKEYGEHTVRDSLRHDSSSMNIAILLDLPHTPYFEPLKPSVSESTSLILIPKDNQVKKTLKKGKNRKSKKL
jgi:hypothetical protein